MNQEFIVILLFIGAIFYIGWRIWKSLSNQNGGCAKGCGCAGDKTSENLLP